MTALEANATITKWGRPEKALQTGTTAEAF